MVKLCRGYDNSKLHPNYATLDGRKGESAARRDKRRTWDVSKQKGNLRNYEARWSSYREGQGVFIREPI
jgi:hypothetical protein